MATSVNTSLPMWLTGCTYDGAAGNDLRNSGITPFFYDQGPSAGSSVIGVLGGVTGGSGLKVSAGSGMTVTVQPGSYVVPVTASPASGGYASTLAQQATLTIQAADPSNPRIDIVVANVADNGNSTSSGQVQVITGTPAASPSAPSVPANSITLAQVSVPAGATSVTSITDTRPFTVAPGGVLPVASKASAPVGYRGMLAFDQTSGSFFSLDGANAHQMRVLPAAPVHTILTGGWIYPGGHFANILSINYTTDGQTDLKITCHVDSITPQATQDVALTHQITIDGNIIHLETKRIASAGNVQQGGFTMIGYTSSAASNTPSNGVHTIAFAGQSSYGASNTPAIHNIAASPISAYLRVEPVGL